MSGATTWTGIADVDHVLGDLAARVANALSPDRYGVYLTGSFATGDGDQDSDIDAAVVWEAAGLPEYTSILVENSIEGSRQLTGRRLDPMSIRTEFLSGLLMAAKMPGLLRSSRLLAGSDLLRGASMPTLDDHTAGLHRRARDLMRRIHSRQKLDDEVPLPDPLLPFFGYTRRLMPWHPDGVDEGTSEIVELTAGLAAPIAAAATGDHVTGKRDAVRKFGDAGDEPWAGLVTRIYQRCRVDWHYRIPEGSVGHEELTHLCLALHAFENHYLDQFGADT